MMKGFIDAVPRDIEEAAKVDGARSATVLVRIVGPMVVPGLLTTAAFTFMNAWNQPALPPDLCHRRQQTDAARRPAA